MSKCAHIHAADIRPHIPRHAWIGGQHKNEKCWNLFLETGKFINLKLSVIKGNREFLKIFILTISDLSGY